MQLSPKVFSGSFFLLLVVSLMVIASAAAFAVTSQDAAYDKSGGFVGDSRGQCVRTKWMGADDPCNPTPPPPPPAPVVAAPPPPPPAPVVKLEARTILFDFDSAELDGEAVNKLVNLLQIINQSRAIMDVHVVGYTDQFGTDSYNMALSQRRVAAVEAFLDQRSRIDTKAASIRALGKAPDDGVCANLPRQEKITCMRPQRRVEIEFKYQQ